MTNEARRATAAWAVAATIAAAAAASTAGAIVRAIEAADVWTVLFFRAAAFSALVLTLIMAKHGARGAPAAARAIGLPGLGVGVALGVAFIAFVVALERTAVANVVFVLAASPFAAAAIAAATLGERPRRATLRAALVAAAGVGLTAAAGVAADGAAGVLWAALACLGYAGAIVGLRAGRDRDMLPAIALSGLIALAISAAAGARPGEITPPDLALALSLGLFQIGLQYVLLTWSAKHLPAPRVALIMLLEIVLAPIWVWAIYGETPAGLALAGGVFILAALLADLRAGAQAARSRHRASAS